MKRIIFVFLVVILLLFLGLGATYLAKDRILTFIVPKIISPHVGTEVRAKNISLCLSEQSLVIEGLQVFSPPGFPKQIMVDVPLIQASIDIDLLFRRQIYLPNVKINIEMINIYINSKRVSNIQAMIDINRTDDKKTAASSRITRRPWSYQIDRLALVLGTVVVRDFSIIEKPAVTPHYIFSYQVYQNISNVQHVGAFLVIDAIKMANIQGLTLQGISSLSSTILSPFTKAGSYVGLDSLTDTVYISAATLTKILFLPFETMEMVVGGGTVKIRLGVAVERVTQGVVNVFQKHGNIMKDDRNKNEIVAKVQAITISVRLKSVPGGTELVIVATERSKSKSNFARGLVYYLLRDLAKDSPMHSTKSLFIK